MGGSFDPGAVARDNDFLKASPADKIAYLSSQDPDFAKASPADQMGYIHHLVGQMQPAGPPTPPPGFMHEAMQDVGGLVKGIATTALNALPGSGFIPASARAKVGLGPPPNPIAEGQQLAANYQQRKQEGRSLPYRLAAGAAETLTPANVPAMEESARKGDVGGVLAHAVVPIAATAAPLGLEGAGRVANRIVPSTTRAGLGLSALTDSPEGVFAQHPVATPEALKTARKIDSELAVTGEKPHPIIQNYMNGEELRQAPSDIAQQARAQGIEVNQPMTMYEARTTLKRVNDIIRGSSGFNADAASRTAIANLKRFAGALDEDISNAANAHGFGEDYAKMRNEYRRGSQIIRVGDEIGAPVGALLGYELGHAAGEPIGGTLAGGAIGKAVGRKTTGAATRAIIERNAGPPRLRSIPSTRESYTRTLLEAKEGLITPEEANRRIQRAGGSIRTRPIPQPD